MIRGPFVVVLVALTIALSACSGGAASAAPTATLVVDCADFESSGGAPLVRDLGVANGQGFEVTLCSNPSTGFGWETPTWDGDPSVELISRGSAEPSGAGVGAAGQETFAFKAIAPGTTVIHFVYSQPWAGGIRGSWQLDLTVTVE